MFRVLLTVCMGLMALNATAQLAQEPTSQPTNLRKDSYDKAWVFDIKFDPSGSANGYLVLRSTEPIVANPVDGVAYTKGQPLGNAKVFSSSASSVVRVKEVGAGTQYYFAVYAYNMSGTNANTINYLQTNPLTSTFTSQDNNPNGYYGGINFADTDMLIDLKNLINPHTLVSYSSFVSTIVNEFHERDTTSGQKVVNCQYSDEYLLYTGSFGLGAYNYSREHRMPFSWVNFSGITRSEFELTPEGCDIHALELVNNDVNFRRSNHPLGEAVTTIWDYLEFTQGRDSRNKDVADVRNDRKGDAARAKFYMMLCYNGKYGENWGLGNLLSDSDNQELQKLIDYHFADLPDGFEKARHEYVFSKQGNRNPFIDYPELVNCINFNDLTLTGDCSQYVGLAQSPVASTPVSVYPQPATDVVNLSFTSKANETATMYIYELSGKLVSQEQFTLNGGAEYITVNTERLTPGYYLFSLQSGQTNGRGRFVVAK